MDYITTTLGNLIHQTAFFNLTVGNFIMILVALFFLFLAIKKGYEPLLLVPIAFGMLLVNLFPDIMKTIEELPMAAHLPDFFIISSLVMNGESGRHLFSSVSVQ